MSYDYNDASRISNEIAAQGEYTRRQNENITYEERIFKLDMAMAKEKDPDVLNELNNLRTQVINEYEDILKERKRQKIINTILGILFLIGLSSIPIMMFLDNTKNEHKTTTPSTIVASSSSVISSSSDTAPTNADPDVIPEAFQGTYRGLDANGMTVEETFYPDGNYVITYDDNPTLNRSGSLTSLVQVSPTVYQLKALTMDDLAKVLPGGQYGGTGIDQARLCWLLKDNQNGTITLEYHQTGKTNGHVDLTDTPNMQATLTKVN
jgi:hypothetical protein